MGVYYKPCAIISEENGKSNIEYLIPGDYDEGDKLREHSYINSTLVMTCENLIAKGGRWYNKPIKWLNDFDDSLAILSHAHINESESYIYYRYLINHSKKEYIDKDKEKLLIINDRRIKYHPLPLMTCEGDRWSLDIIEASNELIDNYKEVFRE